MPRGKKDLAEQITPEHREVEVEVGRGKTVLEAGHAAPQPFYEPLINSKMVAEVPLARLSFILRRRS